jgi:hypothetical protein
LDEDEDGDGDSDDDGDLPMDDVRCWPKNTEHVENYLGYLYDAVIRKFVQPFIDDQLIRRI